MSIDHVTGPPPATETPSHGEESPPAAAPPASTEATPAVPAATRLKHLLLKIVDLSALGFLEPVVRLCYGEEPRTQLRKIGRFVVVPVIAFVLFLLAWTWMSDHIRTKSGQMPTPLVVWQAYDAIMTFHDREGRKEVAYAQFGPEREILLADARRRLADSEAREAEVDAAVAAARETERLDKERATAPLKERDEALRASYREERERRQAALDAQAATVGDEPSREAYLSALAAFESWDDQQKDSRRGLKDQIAEVLRASHPATDRALEQQTAVAEERQYLGKLVDLLGEDNRSVKVAEMQAELAALQTGFRNATGTDLYQEGRSILRTRSRLEAAETSTYAKPWTLPDQIIRSIFCVFVGFLIGSGIAIPIGVLCGLSSTFMAAMTPFIALFKPVSPIVWLPIALIVVGGFIPDPDQHWLMQALWEAPLIGWMKVNPAFIASAITVALCSLWATMVNTALGVASVDQDHLNVARVLRLGFWQRLFKIILPSALPLIFAGLRISLGVGWMVLIAAELLSSSEGIGKFVWDQFNNGASDSFAKMMVVVFVVGIIGLVLDRIMIVFQRLVSFEGSVAAI